jgi:membrane protein involved in colicin uptake
MSPEKSHLDLIIKGGSRGTSRRQTMTDNKPIPPVPPTEEPAAAKPARKPRQTARKSAQKPDIVAETPAGKDDPVAQAKETASKEAAATAKAAKAAANEAAKAAKSATAAAKSKATVKANEAAVAARAAADELAKAAEAAAGPRMESAFEQFLEHQRNAVKEVGRALEAMIPEGVRDHGSTAYKQTIEGYRGLFNAVMDEVNTKVEQFKPEWLKSEDEEQDEEEPEK